MQKSEWLDRMASQQRRFEDLKLEGLAKWTKMITQTMDEHCPDGDIITNVGDDADPLWPLPLLEKMPDGLQEIGASMSDMNQFFVGVIAHMEEMDKKEAATKEAGH